MELDTTKEDVAAIVEEMIAEQIEIANGGDPRAADTARKYLTVFGVIGWLVAKSADTAPAK